MKELVVILFIVFLAIVIYYRKNTHGYHWLDED